MRLDGYDSLLQAGPIRQIRLDLTTRCNLRCVYCAVSHPEYQGRDMADDAAARAVQLISQIAAHNPLDPVDVNGHGETTYRDGWEILCARLLDRGVPLRITTNLAKPYSPAELEVLARMRTIAISIDTDDRALLRAVRRHVDLHNIISNVVMIRAAAWRLGIAAPAITFLSGLYDRNTLNWQSFAQFALALGVVHVELWSLTPHPGMQTAPQDRLVPLDDLDDADLRPRLESIAAGIALLRGNGVPVKVQGDFIARLTARLDARGPVRHPAAEARGNG